MRRSSIGVALLALLAVAPTATAQEAGLTELYGNAVHAFYSGQTQAALDSLTSAIDAGSQDPRVHYYRGLVSLQMNSLEAAEEDFARGAALEAGEGSGLYGVDRALERIQGRTRLVIEKHRSAARLAVLKALSEERARYNQEIESTRPELTVPPRTPATRPAVPLEAPAQPGAPPPAAPTPPAGRPAPRDPLNAPMQNPPAEAEEAPPAQAPPAPGPPVQEPPAAAPTQVDPFKEDDPFKEKANP